MKKEFKMDCIEKGRILTNEELNHVKGGSPPIWLTCAGFISSLLDGKKDDKKADWDFGFFGWCACHARF